MSKSPDFPYLPAPFELERELLDQLSNHPGNQRCVVGRDELLLITHDVPRGGTPSRDALVFWRRQDEVWVDFSGTKGFRKLGELLDRYTRVITEQQTLLDQTTSAAAVFKLARSAGPLARAAKNLATAIDQTLSNDEDNRELRSYRDRAREVERAADQANQDARLALEFQQVELVEKQQQSIDKLTRVATMLVFLMIAAFPIFIFGAVGSMNGGLSRVWFWLFLIAGLGGGAGLVYFLIRRIGLRP
ncbi:hypothetical protein [Luteolibacter luteus]|uniref:Uncharacterized protein n=1 Tax=Luteolibacter luteus TaxID=2728835 RepID=A0A858RQ07_9BACT|nr:hypothetical protein [Luteolibacter luteus]QJE98439.1 hypothetical protein HHL09_22515 [Luteolibacter luteus]